MTSAFESAISDAMAELERQREDLVRLHQNMDGLSATVQSKRRQVSVSADAHGNVVDLQFHGTGYQSLPPTELARIILDTIEGARASAREQLWASLHDSVPDGAGLAEALAADGDWTKVLAESMTLPAPMMEMLGPDFRLFDGTDVSSLFAAPSRGDDGAAGDGTSR